MLVAPEGWPEKVAELVVAASESARIIAIRQALQAINTLALEQQGASFWHRIT